MYYTSFVKIPPSTALVDGYMGFSALLHIPWQQIRKFPTVDYVKRPYCSHFLFISCHLETINLAFSRFAFNVALHVDRSEEQ